MVGMNKERKRIEKMLAKRRLLNKPQKERINLALKEIKDYVELYGSIGMGKVNGIIHHYCVKVDLIEPKLIKLYIIKDNVLLPKNKQTPKTNKTPKTKIETGKQTEVTKEQQEQIDELLRQYDARTKQNKEQNKQFKHCCYRFLDKYGNLLYVGRAKDVRDRMKSHEHLGEECYQQISKIQFVSFDNEDDLDIAERYYISKLKPIYNKEFKNKHFSFNLEELDKKQWTTWEQGLELIHRG